MVPIGELDILAGRAWKFKDDIDTDAIIPGRYLVMNDPQELAAHLFEGVRPEMAGAVKEGDYVVVGIFGWAHHESTHPALKGAGISAVPQVLCQNLLQKRHKHRTALFICPMWTDRGGRLYRDRYGGRSKEYNLQ